MRLPLLLATATLALCMSAAELHEAYIQGFVTPNNITPTFDRGYLLVHDYPKIDVYSAHGSPLYSIAPAVGDVKFAHIENAAADLDGTVAVAVEYAKANKRGGGVAVFDTAGKQSQFFDTGKYLPTQVAFAEDDSIWALGWQGAQSSSEEYFLLRHYSQHGQELGAFLPRSSFDATPDPIGPIVGGVGLRIAGGKIGALLYASSVLHPGEESREALWIELDSEGRELGRWHLGAYTTSVLTQSGALYTARAGRISIFDRSAKVWRRVAAAPDGFIVGADGDSIVFALRGTNTLRWVPVSQ